MVEIDGSFHQTGSQLYYDILGNSSNGTPGLVGRYRVDPGTTANFSVYNNKLNGGNVTSYPLFINPTQRRIIATQLCSEDSTFQTFVNNASTPSKTTVPDANPDDTFSMTGWNTAQPGAYLTGIRISAQKQAPADDTSAKLYTLRLVEVEPQRDIVDDAIDQLSMNMVTDTPSAVTGDLKPLPQTLAGANIIWTSSNPELLSDSGELIGNVVYDTDVVLTAKLTNPIDGFTKYVDFRLTLVMQNGFAEKFDTDVTGTPSSNGQPGTTTFAEYPMWTFSYPGLTNGTNGEVHNSQVLVHDGYLTLKKISNRQTDSYGECLVATRPLSRDQENPAFRGTAQLLLTSKVYGSGTCRYTVLSDDGRKPFELVLDASVKNVKIVYGSDDQGNAITQTLDIDPTIEHIYRLVIDTSEGFILSIDDEMIKTEQEGFTRAFLAGVMPRFNISKLKMWITNISMENTEVGYLKSLLYREIQPLMHAGFEDAEEIQPTGYVQGPSQNQMGDNFYKFSADWDGECIIDFHSNSDQCNITLYDSDYHIIDSSSELSPDNSMRISGVLEYDHEYYIRVKSNANNPYTISIERSYYISAPNITVNESSRTVQIWGSSLLSEIAINLTVFDPDNALAYIANIYTDTYGYYSRTFTLPEDAADGTYQVFVTSGYTNKTVGNTFDYHESSEYTPIVKSVLQNKPLIHAEVYDLYSNIISRTDEENTQYLLATYGNVYYTILTEYAPYVDYLIRDFQVVLNIYDTRDNSLYYTTSQTINDKACLELEGFYIEAEIPQDYSYYQAQLLFVDGSDVYGSYNTPISTTYFRNLGTTESVSLGMQDSGLGDIMSISLGEVLPSPMKEFLPLPANEAAIAEEILQMDTQYQTIPFDPEIVEEDISYITDFIEGNSNLAVPQGNEPFIIPYVPRYPYFGTERIEYNLTMTVNGKQSDRLIPAGTRGEVILELYIKNTLTENIDGLTIQYGYFEPTVLENGEMTSARMTLYEGKCAWTMYPGSDGRITVHLPIRNVGSVAKQYGNLPLYLVVSETNGTGNTFYDTLVCVNAFNGKPNAPYGTSIETSYNLKADTPFEETLASGGYAYHHFRPRSSGVYVFNSSSFGVQGELFELVNGGESLVASDYNVDLGGFHMVVQLEAGKDYYLKTYNNSPWSRSTTMRVTNTRTDSNYLKVKTSMSKEPYDVYEINAGNVTGNVLLPAGEKQKREFHYIDVGFSDESGEQSRLCGKTVALSYLDKTLEQPPAGVDFEAMEVKGLKEDGTEISFVKPGNLTATFFYPEGSGGGDNKRTGLRFLNLFDSEEFIAYYIQTGLNSNGGAPYDVNYQYTVSLKILDQPAFEPSRPDATAAGSTDKNFMISSGPEGIQENSLYSNSSGTYLCAAPVNGMADIYWHHTNQTWRNIYFGALLWNRESFPVEITMHSKNYTHLNKTWQDDLFTELWYNNGAGGWAQDGFETDLTGEFQYAGSTYTLQPGQAVWLSAYELPGFSDKSVSATNGIIRLSIKRNGAYYTGQNVVCKTYAFDQIDYLSQIPNWAGYAFGNEAEPDGTAIRGSGNGALMRFTAVDEGETFKTLRQDQPFEFVMTGRESPALSEEQFFLSRYIDSGTTLYVSEKIAEGGIKTVSEYMLMGLEAKRPILSQNPNYGVVYRLDVPQFKAPAGATVVGKVKYTPRTNGSYVNDSGDGLHVAVWRKEGDNITLAFTDILTRGRGNAIGGDINSGVYYIFDNNVPTDTPVTYYFVGCGMSSMPYQISFEVE